jgi:hypothetical protein
LGAGAYFLSKGGFTKIVGWKQVHLTCWLSAH